MEMQAQSNCGMTEHQQQHAINEFQTHIDLWVSFFTLDILRALYVASPRTHFYF